MELCKRKPYEGGSNGTHFNTKENFKQRKCEERNKIDRMKSIRPSFLC